MELAGILWTVMSPIIILILGRYFGRKAFGSILGTMVALLAPMGLLASVYSGWTYDSTGSYIVAFMTFGAMAMCSAIIMLFVRAPRPIVDDITHLTR